MDAKEDELKEVLAKRDVVNIGWNRRRRSIEISDRFIGSSGWAVSVGRRAGGGGTLVQVRAVGAEGDGRLGAFQVGFESDGSCPHWFDVGLDAFEDCVEANYNRGGFPGIVGFYSLMISDCGSLFDSFVGEVGGKFDAFQRRLSWSPEVDVVEEAVAEDWRRRGDWKRRGEQ